MAKQRRNPKAGSRKPEAGSREPEAGSRQPAAGSRKPLAAAAAILAAVCLAAYWNSFRAELLLDNATIILKDPRLRSIEWQSVRDIFAQHYWWPSLESRLFRPVTTLTYWLNFSVLGNGARPFGYHAVNLLFHWTNAFLVFALVRSVSRRPWPALAAAAVFAVHPLTVEAVTNVVGRADLLAAMSVTGGLLLYIRSGEATGGRRAALLTGLGVTCLAGVFSKESAVVLPAVMLLHDAATLREGPLPIAATLRRWLARTWTAYLCLLPGLGALFWARWTLFRYSPLFGEFGSDNPIAVASLGTGIMTAVKVAGYYLALVVWPSALSVDYSYNAVTLFGGSLGSGQDPHAWAALAVLSGLVAGAVAGWRHHRAVAYLAGFSAAAFLPVSNLLFPIGTIMAERLMYLPLAGIAGAAALALASIGRRALGSLPATARRRATLIVAFVAAAGFVTLIARTTLRNQDWTTDERLWSSSARAAPESIKVIRGLAAARMASDPSGGRVDEALAIALRGVKIAEQSPLPLAHQPAALYEQVGSYYFAKARQFQASGAAARARDAADQAVAMLKRAERIDREINRLGRERLIGIGLAPDRVRDHGTPSIYRNLGAVDMARGEPEAAVAALTYLVHIQPVSYDAVHDLGMAEAAAAAVERASGNDEHANAHLEEAAVNLIEALLLNPGPGESLRALDGVYRLLGVPAAVNSSGDGPPLNMEHPVVRRHFTQACTRLVRQLADAGMTDEADRWRQRMISDLGVPPDSFGQASGARPAGR